MRRKGIRTPHDLSIIERMQQEQAGIEPGTLCCVQMVKGTGVYRGGHRVGTIRDGGRKIGPCPRYAVVLVDGVPLCDAHKYPANGAH
jgi:hypothetical protein